MKNLLWLNLVDAVRAVREAGAVTDGAACTLLCQACQSGVVRSRKQPWPEPDEPPELMYNPPIPIEDWHGASIELLHGWLILAEDKILRADVEVNAADLCSWLGVEETKPKEVIKPTTVPGKRGPKPRKFEAIKRQMWNDIAANRISEPELREMNQEALAENYNVSRDTACKARNAVLSAFGANSISDK
jgi:hypothetical protein